MDINKVIDEFIELKEELKQKEKRLAALETIILDERPKNDRIVIVSGRKTIVIKPETYQTLDASGIETTIVETRLRKIDEFDSDTRTVILSNPENVIEKTTKEWIRIRKEKNE
jgi:hypothetical protein